MGNIAKVMLNTSNRILLTSGIDNSERRSKIEQIALNMAVILTIIILNKKVKIIQYKDKASCSIHSLDRIQL